MLLLFLRQGHGRHYSDRGQYAEAIEEQCADGSPSMPRTSTSSAPSARAGARGRCSSWRKYSAANDCCAPACVAWIWVPRRAAGASTPCATWAATVAWWRQTSCPWTPFPGCSSSGRLSRGRRAGPAPDGRRGRQSHLVMSDMAPNMAGIDAVDQPRSMHLAELALEFADRILAPGGDLLVKLFQGEGFDQIIKTHAAATVGLPPKSQRRHERAVLRSICWRASLGWCNVGNARQPFLSYCQSCRDNTATMGET